MKNFARHKKNVLAFALMAYGINATAQEGWEVNPAEYQYTMTFTGVGVFSCDTTENASDKVAAFINDECRGVAQFDTDVDGRQLAYLTVYDNNALGNDVEFRLYDATNQSITVSPASIPFEDGGIVGDAVEPYRFRTDFALSSLGLSRDTIYDFFVDGTEVGELFMLNENGDTLSGDFSFVDGPSGPDNDTFSLVTSFLIFSGQENPTEQDSYQVHLNGTLPSGCSISEVFNLPVINTNEAPTALAVDTFRVAENLPVGSFTGAMEAVDPSISDFHVFSFAYPDSGGIYLELFEIQGSELFTTRPLDFEMQQWYEIPILIVDQTGNSVIDTLVVEVLDEVELNDLKAGNFISPDMDGVNDYFEIPNVGIYQGYELKIFNAMGALIFNTDAYDNRWAATSNGGSDLPSGTYYYVFEDKANDANSFQGEIHVYRTNKF